ncbi:hypothetical protein ACFOYW_00420 [Gryllotalpicola reticulitermitis]|uniref:Uncharacterized protein n=1 Tax=Gryllotalpicola reticulitermitis TaxID=1184153 RepID=A0ABV8Q213_9MICO
MQLTLFSGWTWIAAGSLIGFEMFDVIFGAFLLAPELIPAVILTLALTWYFRRTLHRAWRRGRARWRLARMTGRRH